MDASSIKLHDIDKIRKALDFIKLPSLMSLIKRFSLSTLPHSQRMGILAGIAIFTCTVISVILLLFLGGSFDRIKEQAKNGDKPLPHENIRVRENRPLLLERLLEAREWMLRTNYPKKIDVVESEATSNISRTSLLKMLLNVSPPNHNPLQTGAIAPISDDDEIAVAYQKDYVHAYYRSIDKPGAQPIPGHPEALFEAYARAYAGCGTHPKTSYRRSYARVYQMVSCKNSATVDFYEKLFVERPYDLVGRTIRLEPLQADRHVKGLYKVTSGEQYDADEMQYNPSLIWAFLDCGPFQDERQMEQCPELFHRGDGEAAFCIIDSSLNTPCGVIIVTNDDPKNLTIDIEPPIVKLNARGTEIEMEAVFLIMDRLFALGYRRIQMLTDALDYEARKLPARMGFTQEALLIKHRIIKASSRDSVVYGMLNSDWDKGARSLVFGKLHGKSALKVETQKEKGESQLEHHTKRLAERRIMEEEAALEEEEDVGNNTCTTKGSYGHPSS